METHRLEEDEDGQLIHRRIVHNEITFNEDGTEEVPQRYWCNSPCADCPFRKDSLEGWLGESRAKEIIESDTFVCHKTTHKENVELKQCAGYLILKMKMGELNGTQFFRVAKALGYKMTLKNIDKIFDSKEQFIKHHSVNFKNEESDFSED